MKKALYIFLLAIITASPVYAEDMIDSSGLDVHITEEMSMTGAMADSVLSAMTSSQAELPTYNLARMKQLNPDFTTYPEANGIIWLKHVVANRAPSGGMEIVRLYVILGRQGLGGKWLNWNIPTPTHGDTEILEAAVYDFRSMARVGRGAINEDSDAGIKHVNFSALPETYILALSWRETLPEKLSVEGLCWFQEDLRVWESIVEVYSPEPLVYQSFPDRRTPAVNKLRNETSYMWRKLNIEPYADSGELARFQRHGVAFGVRQGTSGIMTVLKDAGASLNIAPQKDALSGFKRTREEGIDGLIAWLKDRPEIELAEGDLRHIPSTGALTRREKLLLARSWLATQKVDVSLCWQLPFEPDNITPLCPEMFYDPVLQVAGRFYDMTNENILDGAKIFFTDNWKLHSRRIPSSSASNNRLSAVMDLRVGDTGLLNGTVRVSLRGAWGAFLLGDNPSDGRVRGALLSMFPGLTNYKDVKYSRVKNIPEISFAIENKPGIAGEGNRILAMIPFFEPVAMRKLGLIEPTIEVLFPFIVDQNITLGFPKSATSSTLEGTVPKNPDKINFSSRYQNRRHRLEANARIEVNMSSITSGNMSLLQRSLDLWRVFSSRSIPVR